MSRIGRTPISIPSGVTVTVQSDSVTVKGPKGELTTRLLPAITVKVAEDKVEVSRDNDERQTKAYHGLIRSLVENTIIGVSEGYKKTLKLIGTGYRVKMSGANLELSVGYSHPIIVKPMPGITFKLEGNDTIHVEGIDKQLVGQMAADIRAHKPPEPYKGKGVRYEGEEVKLKPGKAAVA